ncbi:hypothetical protein FJ527_01270 [Mesorhizobium sp. B2-4-18]|uniref:hypothetical protein n=1 Tax=Mesorhizobium sp. B2-4-18 TaxID=2589931 RepID=UPI00112D6001|nr:hypothetical protein [Mesorhizobium sp. B2-4-18]TPK80433.1 hypothetical protein FJ527_01270 [Mesorhizobium sp. B2-4-18]
MALVVRHSDGEWQLTCGEHDHPADCGDFEVVGLKHLIDRQENLAGIAKLEPGWLAEWMPGKWTRCRHDD